jgi:hypothetical protein
MARAIATAVGSGLICRLTSWTSTHAESIPQQQQHGGTAGRQRFLVICAVVATNNNHNNAVGGKSHPPPRQNSPRCMILRPVVPSSPPAEPVPRPLPSCIVPRKNRKHPPSTCSQLLGRWDGDAMVPKSIIRYGGRQIHGGEVQTVLKKIQPVFAAQLQNDAATTTKIQLATVAVDGCDGQSIRIVANPVAPHVRVA